MLAETKSCLQYLWSYGQPQWAGPQWATWFSVFSRFSLFYRSERNQLIKYNIVVSNPGMHLEIHGF